MKRILILINSSGGLYHFRKELVSQLVKTYEVFIAVPQGGYVEYFQQIGCHVLNINMKRRSFHPKDELSLIWQYQNIFRQVQPDLVLTYTIKPNIYGGMLCQQLHIPYITNITGMGVALENKGILKYSTMLLYRLALQKVQVVFFQNTANYQFFKKYILKSQETVLLPGSGVNLQQHCYEPYPEDDETTRFLMIGRIMKDKGIDEFLECARRIKAHDAKVIFDLLGSYDEHDYQTIIDELNQQGVICYHGAQSNVHNWLKTHHAIIHPSYHEGMSNVLLEAAACGRPIIASKIPGCQEIFDEGVTGLGFQPKNVDDLCRAVNVFLQLPYTKKAEMGFAGRHKIEKEFDRNFIVEAYLREIYQILK